MEMKSKEKETSLNFQDFDSVELLSWLANDFVSCFYWVTIPLAHALPAPTPGSPVFLPPQKPTLPNPIRSGIRGPQVCQSQDCYVLPSLNKVFIIIILLLLQILSQYKPALTK